MGMASAVQDIGVADMSPITLVYKPRKPIDKDRVITGLAFSSVFLFLSIIALYMSLLAYDVGITSKIFPMVEYEANKKNLSFGDGIDAMSYVIKQCLVVTIVVWFVAFVLGAIYIGWDWLIDQIVFHRFERKAPAA